MRAHKGIRPQDIIVLLKLVDAKDKRQVVLAKALHMSQAEISDSLNRSVASGLIAQNKKQVFKSNLMEFLQFGIKYTFPAIPGRRQRGLATGHSAIPLKNEIKADIDYVWPYYKGDILGESIEPLHKNQHLAAMDDPVLYEKLALIDAIRLRNPRETELAVKYLKERMEYER